LRYFSSLTWKVPSVAIAIVTTLMAISTQISKFSLEAGFLVIFGMALLIALILITKKYRLYEDKSAVVMKQLEKDFQNKKELKVYPLPVERAETLIFLRNWQKLNPQPKIELADRIRYPIAYLILQGLMVIFVGILLVFSCYANYFHLTTWCNRIGLHKL
jgi:hypothetical protein